MVTRNGISFHASSKTLSREPAGAVQVMQTHRIVRLACVVIVFADGGGYFSGVG
jgi:hypothetical protein